MKQKRKGQFPLWAKPIVWGNGKLSRILWLNLVAGTVLAGAPLYWFAQKNSQSLETTGFILSLVLLMLFGFYLSIASAYLIFWGYAEDEDL